MKIGLFNPQIILAALKIHEDGILNLEAERNVMSNELNEKALEIQKLIKELNIPGAKSNDMFYDNKIKKVTEGQIFLKEKQEEGANILKEKEEELLFQCSKLVSETVEKYCVENKIDMLFNDHSVAYINENVGGSINDFILEKLLEQNQLNEKGIQYLKSK